jgi:hypothetical protein
MDAAIVAEQLEIDRPLIEDYALKRGAASKGNFRANGRGSLTGAKRAQKPNQVAQFYIGNIRRRRHARRW